jgi:hypothetical protein
MPKQKTQKVQLKGSPHVFKEGDKINKHETVFTCEVCGISGTRFNKQNYIEVNVNRKNKKLIDTCKTKPDYAESNIKIYKDKMMLPVKYDNEKLSEYGKRLVEEMKKKDAIEDEKETAISDFKARKNACDEIIQKYAEAINKGGEDQNIEVEVKLHFPEMHKKTISRLDTNEIIYQDIMLDDDYDLFKGQEGQNPEPENVIDINNPDEQPIVETQESIESGVQDE